ncbi:MAG: class I SAM-dependent methyltransferase [Thermoleophilaceae bacterium]
MLCRCSRCGTAITEGGAPGAELYESGIYAPGEPRAAKAVRAIQRAVIAQPVRMLRRAGVAPGARVLDAGAGRGRLVAALGAAGFDARGIEPSARSVAQAVAPVEQRTIGEHYDDGLDAVVLWHVLEHLDDPAAALRRIAGWLRPGGMLLLGVPNAASLQARIGGPGWLHFDAPRHRTHFTPAGLDAILAATGFAPARTHHLVWEHNLHGMWMAMLTRLGMRPGFPFHLLKRNIDPRPKDLALLALGVPLAPLATALEAGAAAARRGGTVAILARRTSNCSRAEPGDLQPSPA